MSICIYNVPLLHLISYTRRDIGRKIVTKDAWVNCKIVHTRNNYVLANHKRRDRQIILHVGSLHFTYCPYLSVIQRKAVFDQVYSSNIFLYYLGVKDFFSTVMGQLRLGQL